MMKFKAIALLVFFLNTPSVLGYSWCPDGSVYTDHFNTYISSCFIFNEEAGGVESLMVKHRFTKEVKDFLPEISKDYVLDDIRKITITSKAIVYEFKGYNRHTAKRHRIEIEVYGPENKYKLTPFEPEKI